MSKKHYEQLAQMVRDFRHMGMAQATLEKLTLVLADICERNNNNFDRERFIAACERES
jgi:hypothetical protein